MPGGSPDHGPMPSQFTPPPSLLGQAARMGLLDERARDIFRRVVETYLETGEPVGSRTVSRGGVPLSSASIRNTMQDLTQLGLLAAPHTSAGRLPTHAGLRLFVDGLLEIGDLGEDERRAVESRLIGRGRSFEDALEEASGLLSGLAGGAGIVVAPSRDNGVKHVEFVALSPEQTLAVMVFEDGAVENRLMRTPAGLTPSALAGGLQLPQRAPARTHAGGGQGRSRHRTRCRPPRTRRHRRAAGGGWAGGLGRIGWRQPRAGADRAGTRQPACRTPRRARIWSAFGCCSTISSRKSA